MEEKSLIKKIKNRDEKGLIEFINIYGPTIKSAIYPVLSQHKELIDEVLNESLLAIWENINSFDSGRSSLKNWSATVAKYKAIDALRKELRHTSVNIESIESLSCTDIHQLDEVDQILKHLTPDDQNIFKKLFIEGYSYDDISKDLKISKKALYNRVSRGKKLLKKFIKTNY